MRVDRAYLAQLRLLDIYGVEPTEAQRRAVENYLRDLISEAEIDGYYEGRDDSEAD